MHLLRPAFLLILATALCATASAADFSRPKSRPKPVRTALERRYAEMRKAYFAGDSSTILAMRLPATFSITPAGDTLDAASMHAYTRASFEQVRRTLALEWSLGTIDVQGDTAAAEVDQHWVRRQMKAGAVREVDTRAHQRETWLRQGEQWFLWRVDQIQPGIWRVDGKRVDPSKPYDPRAPEPGAR